MKRVIYEPLLWFTRVLGILAMGVRVYGRENLPENGGFIIASNHQSFYDPVLLGLSSGRQLGYLARRSLFRKPAFARLIRTLGAIDFGRDTVDSTALRRMAGELKGGKPVVMFPEGTRTTDGSIGELKGGVGVVAKLARVPVVPTAIEGAHKAWPRNSNLPGLFRPVRVAFGKPMEAPKTKAEARQFHPELEKALRKLKNGIEKKR